MLLEDQQNLSVCAVTLLQSDTFWVAMGSIGAMITLVLIYYQLRTSRMIAAADFLLKLEKVFYSDDMRKHRRRIMEVIRRNPDDFEYLFKRILKLEERKRHRKIHITPQQIDEFVEEETKL